jgi:hypothetical protein
MIFPSFITKLIFRSDSMSSIGLAGMAMMSAAKPGARVPHCWPGQVRRFLRLAFSLGRAEWRADSWAHWATGNREWCSPCGADGRETRLAIPLFVVSLHERTGLQLVQRCIPSAGLKRVVFPRLGIFSKNGGRPGRIRMRSNNRFRPLCQVRRAPGGTKHGIRRRHPRQILPRRNKLRDTCRLAPDRLP